MDGKVKVDGGNKPFTEKLELEFRATIDSSNKWEFTVDGKGDWIDPKDGTKYDSNISDGEFVRNTLTFKQVDNTDQSTVWWSGKYNETTRGFSGELSNDRENWVEVGDFQMFSDSAVPAPTTAPTTAQAQAPTTAQGPEQAADAPNPAPAPTTAQALAQAPAPAPPPVADAPPPAPAGRNGS